MKPLRGSWPLISAVALMAMVAGHAAELGLENLGFLSDVRAGYAHVGQGFVAAISAALVVGSASLLLRQFLAAFRSGSASSATLFPAPHALCKLGAWRVAASVVGVQLTALVAIESLEQRLSHFAGYGMGAVFGSGHGSAILVHIAIGALCGLVLWILSRAACRHVASAIEIAIFLVAPGRPTGAAISPALRARLARFAVAVSCELALRIANRPPPFSPLNA